MESKPDPPPRRLARGLRARFAGALPALSWLRTYQRAWLRADILGGITLAAYLLPAGIGDASLANLPPEAGLYACLFPGLVFWLFCDSRQTSITVTSALSLMIGASLGPLSGGDPVRFYALASATALLMAGLYLVAWLARAGAITSFISDSVLVGFKAGVALYLGSTQLPKLCGFKGAGESFWQRTGHILGHLGDSDATSLALGLGALALLLLGKRYWKGRPVALVVVVLGILATSLAGLEERGVKTLGVIPRGLPSIGLPAMTASDLNALLPLVLACFLIGAVETVAIGRMHSTGARRRFDSNQELLALAAANAAAGLGRGFPVGGGMSQSMVNQGSGARTPISTLVAALLVLLVTVFFSEALRDLPQPVLAAIVLTAVLGLFKPSAFRRLWRANRYEFFVAFAALNGVLASGLLRGVLIGALISLVQLIRRAARPHVAFLGRIPGTRRFSDLARHPDNERVPGALIFRPESSLLYFNVDHVHDLVVDAVHAADPAPKLVVGDLSAAPHVDIAGAQMLHSLVAELAALGADLRLVEARASVRDILRIEGVEERAGPLDRTETVADALEAMLDARDVGPRPAAADPAN